MIKKRTRPHPRIREPSPPTETDKKIESGEELDEEERGLPLADLIELRKLRRARQGIDSSKLVVGDAKRKRRATEDDDLGGKTERGGLRAVTQNHDDEDADGDDIDARTRKSVRTNNFTQQTGALDVDKHMMAYIEENMAKRKGQQDEKLEDVLDPADPYAELQQLAAGRSKAQKEAHEEGSVAGSLAMLTAIPEVDLGMDARLKNIEETEKAKRQAAEARKERKRINEDDDLAATRFYRGNHKPKSDADIIRDAKLEAMGLPPHEEPYRHNEQNQLATDEMVMERFKKRMRK